MATKPLTKKPLTKKLPLYRGSDYVVTAYTEAGVRAIGHHIAVANQIVRQDMATVKDEGTCVLGSGLQIWYLPPRCRNPIRKLIVHGPYQGNVSNHRVTQRALTYLQARGIDAKYYDGVMD